MIEHRFNVEGELDLSSVGETLEGKVSASDLEVTYDDEAVRVDGGTLTIEINENEAFYENSSGEPDMYEKLLLEYMHRNDQFEVRANEQLMDGFTRTDSVTDAAQPGRGKPGARQYSNDEW